MKEIKDIKKFGTGEGKATVTLETEQESTILFLIDHTYTVMWVIS